MAPPDHSKMVLAYVQSKDKNYLLITLALYDSENEKWIDMMRDETVVTNLDVVHWVEIPENLPDSYKFYTSLKMHKYRTIYKNNVFDKVRR